jgi:hypothetical protein
MAAYYSDLHCHSPLFSFNRLLPHTWYEWYFPFYPAQGDFSQLARGNVRVVMISLYPIEQGFVRLNLMDLHSGGITDFLAKLIVGIPKKRSDEIQNFNHDYFEDLQKELDFLQKSAEPVTHNVLMNAYERKTFRYRIVRDFDDLKNLLNLTDNLEPGAPCDDTIAVILTIEGAHSLGVGQKNTSDVDVNKLMDKLKENILKMKRLGPPGKEGDWCPFFVSLDHHFWNQLGGHAISLWKIIRKALNQSPGLNAGITILGEYVVDAFLSTENGRRILIDSAHMSIKVRKWYYDYLEKRGDNIPIFISHTGVNGIRTMAESEIITTDGDPHDAADKLYLESTDFNPWDIFISDEEIMKIHNSGGMIGLNLDERIMMGKKKLDEIKKQLLFKSKEAARKIWIKPLIDEILHIAGHILSQTGNIGKIWDNISIGSDFNGMITPIKAFDNAEKMPSLDETMFKELKKLVGKEETLAGKTDADIREITDKILWKNNLEFLKKHFR